MDKDAISKIMAGFGKKGGDTTKARGSDYYRALQMKAVASRRAKKSRDKV